MRRRNLSDEELNHVIHLKRAGASWVKIQRETGINRRTAKRAYEKWEHSKSLDELKEARKEVGVQAFREHMDSLVTLATSLVMNLDIPFSLDEMRTNAEEFSSWLLDQDLLHRYISPQEVADVYTMGYTQPFHIGDPQFYRREKELLFESLKVHTREKIRWEDVWDNRWKKARDNCAKIVHELREETSKVVNNYLKLERETKLIDRVKAEGREDDPVKWMVEVVLREIWRAILRDKLDEEGPWFETVSHGKGAPKDMDIMVRCRNGGEKVFTFIGSTNMGLAEKVTRICNWAANNLCKRHTAQQLHDEVRKMEKANNELREMLNPVKLRPMILRTRCDLCPA